MADPSAPTAEQVLAALREVIDPEIGINVVDLGLVYRVEVAGADVRVAMTMTTPVCPMGESLAAEAEAAILRAVPGVASATVDLVWEPAWGPALMSPAARAQLGWAE